MEGESGEYCEKVAFILSNATVLEALHYKPGNASRTRDIKGVKFSDLVKSALLSTNYYKTACIRGSSQEKPLYDLLYMMAKISKTLHVNFSILGTAMQLLPLAYSSSSTDSIGQLIFRATQLIRSLDSIESRYFKMTLEILQLSYLGKLDRGYDYREQDDNLSLFEILKISAFDSAVRNMLDGYKYSLWVAKLIEQEGYDRGILLGFLKVLCELPDGLIFRRNGGRIAMEVSKLACQCLSNEKLVSILDEYLVSRGYNPGSTADIVAVGIAIHGLGVLYGDNGTYNQTSV
ncbi:triphosphoribosyl-dephospho-CoA synthase [Sulfolobus acidocaldarius SUSAZ]|nr:triphosphoribosyl-dephospho-CoA synthase [Sulfolobus acidocaldarius SUSAZ]